MYGERLIFFFTSFWCQVLWWPQHIPASVTHYWLVYQSEISWQSLMRETCNNHFEKNLWKVPQSSVPSQRTVRKIARRRKINRLFRNIQLCLEVLQFVSLQMLINVNLLFQDHENSLLESLFQEDILWKFTMENFSQLLLILVKIEFSMDFQGKSYILWRTNHTFFGEKIPNSKYVGFIKF